MIFQDTREKCSDLENRNVSLAADKERLKVQVKEKESQLRVVQNERECLERDVAHYISEIKVDLVGGSLQSSYWLFLAFCSKILGGDGDLWMVRCHSMSVGLVVGTLKFYHMVKNLFELFALTGGRDKQNLRYKRSCPGRISTT